MNAERGAPQSGRSDATTVELSRGSVRGPWAVEVGSPCRSELFPLAENAKFTLGTGPRADIRVVDRTVSSTHVRIEATSNGVMVEDLDSKNGVHVGGARVRTAWLAGAPSS